MTEKTQNILLIGATGFTGKRVLKKLSQMKHVNVTCLIRKGREPSDIQTGHYTIVRGSLDNKEDIQKALFDKDGVIYVASLGFGHAENIVSACEEMKTSKCVFTSTTAVLTKLNASSKTVRLAAEKRIQHSALTNWTIIRPTMIYGRKGDRNMERLVKFLKKWPLFFMPGNGQALQQPNHVDDVADALIGAYFSSKTKNKIYNISGKDALTFKDCILQICEALNKKVFIVSIPLKPCLWSLKIIEIFIKNPRIKSEQLLRLEENKAFDHKDAENDFGFTPKSFKDGIEELVKTLGEK